MDETGQGILLTPTLSRGGEREKSDGRPPVSVIIPTWNRAREVREAIDSVLAQTYRPIEVIVVDDGSTDETPAVLGSYGDAIRTIRQENRGVSAARNAGIAAASGELIAFLDSDDTWLPAKIERQVALLEGAGAVAVCCLTNSLEIGPSGRSLSFENQGFKPSASEGLLLNVTEILLTRFMVFAPVGLIRREALACSGGFDRALPVMEDHDLALRLSLLGPWVYTTEALAIIRRESAGSLTESVRHERRPFWGAVVRIHEKMLAEPGRLSPREARMVRRNLRRARRELRRAEAGMATGRVRPAVRRLCGWGWRRLPWYPRPRVRPMEAAFVARAGEGAPMLSGGRLR